MPTVAFKTLGCKLNQYETEAVRAGVEDAGFCAVPFDGPADFYVVNTCTVTHRSDYKSRQLVRRVCRERPDARVVVTGCYADLAPEVFTPLGPNVTVVPNNDKERIPALIAGRAGEADAVPGRRVTRFAGKTRLFLKVQDGCDHACAYCVVVIARGPSRSRPAPDVVADVRDAVSAGIKEIVLVGVDLGSYGRGRDRRSLASLLAELSALPGEFRLRLSSVDVSDFEPALVGEVAGGGRVCPHVHLPLQSGDDGVLRRMRRRYRATDYRDLCLTLLERAGDVAIGADVIAGLPGEDAAAFEKTLALVEEIPFAYLHVFPYSPRPRTDAAAMSDQVPPGERERRAALLRELAAAKRRSYERRFAGRVRPALVEERRAGRGSAVVLTDNYLRVPLRDYEGPGNVFADATLVDGDDGLAAFIST